MCGWQLQRAAQLSLREEEDGASRRLDDAAATARDDDRPAAGGGARAEALWFRVAKQRHQWVWGECPRVPRAGAARRALKRTRRIPVTHPTTDVTMTVSRRAMDAQHMPMLFVMDAQQLLPPTTTAAILIGRRRRRGRGSGRRAEGSARQQRQQHVVAVVRRRGSSDSSTLLRRRRQGRPR